MLQTAEENNKKRGELEGVGGGGASCCRFQVVLPWREILSRCGVIVLWCC